MEASELRIGNLIQSIIPITGSLAERQRFDKEFYIVGVDTFEISKIFKGIPLTQGWLYKFGKKDNRGLLVENSNYPIGDLYIDSYNGNDDEIYLRNCFSGYTFGIQIKYVHQLQNLYFDLTGKKLIFINQFCECDSTTIFFTTEMDVPICFHCKKEIKPVKITHQ